VADPRGVRLVRPHPPEQLKTCYINFFSFFVALFTSYELGRDVFAGESMILGDLAKG